VWEIIFLVFLIVALYPLVQRKVLEQQRMSVLRTIERKRRSRAMVMIHRQEIMSILGIPLSRYISIEDSENLLRAIRQTPDDVPIDLVLHTPGGVVLAAEQIALALKKHPAAVTVFLPHYAMSGGTLIALAADSIVMDSNAVLGPVDPQIRTGATQYPAVSVIKALEEPNPHRDDETLILGDIARKAVAQVREVIYNLVKDRMEKNRAEELARALSEGRWTHDFPISLELASSLGLPVKEGLPAEVFELMKLYPQPPQSRPTVEYIPGPHRPFRRFPDQRK